MLSKEGEVYSRLATASEGTPNLIRLAYLLHSARSLTPYVFSTATNSMIAIASAYPKTDRVTIPSAFLTISAGKKVLPYCRIARISIGVITTYDSHETHANKNPTSCPWV